MAEELPVLVCEDVELCELEGVPDCVDVPLALLLCEPVCELVPVEEAEAVPLTELEGVEVCELLGSSVVEAVGELAKQ